MKRPEPDPELCRRWPEILAAALLVGVSGDTLLRAWPWGLGVALWVALVLAFLLALLWRAGGWLGDGAWPAAVALLAGFALAWRDAESLQLLNVVVILVAGGLTVARTRQTSAFRSGVGRLATDLMRAGGAAALGGFPLLFTDNRCRQEGPAWWNVALAGLRGLVIAAPVLGIFALVLSLTDPVFRTLFIQPLGRPASHFFTVLVLAWAAAGAYREALAGRPWVSPETEPVRWPRLGPIEVAVLLGSLNTLFLAFVSIQFRYLFGGLSPAGLIPGLTHAEYARRGFAELVLVAALVLAVLLVTQWLLRRDRRADLAYRALASVMVGLLAVMMASGLYRMWLYYQRFGLTPARLYATAFMIGLAAILALFLTTVLWGRRERFATGALVVGLAVVVLLNLVNPDALVTRVNTRRGDYGRPVDARLLVWLSADAVPALVASLDVLPGEERAWVASVLLGRWGGDPRGPDSSMSQDWRNWNCSRAKARRVVDAHRPTLERYTLRLGP